MATPAPASRVPAATWLLVAAQAINLTCAVISVTVAAVLGAQLAPSPAWGTVPYGLQFAALMACTYPASMLMRRFGRRPVFGGGAVMLAASGACGYLAASHASFAWLVAAHVLLGVFLSCANFYRFAAVDGVPAEVKPRALSLVVAGGVVAALVGPPLASTLRVVPGFADFALCYAVLVALALATGGLLVAWRPATDALPAAAPPPAPTSAAADRHTRRVLLTAVVVSAGAFLMMNLVMVQASLVMRGICSFDAASRAIQAHVLAMFLPSFATGPLLARLGVRRVLVAGCLLMFGAAVAGLQTLAYDHVVVLLVLAGLGWNFAFVGGSTLLAQRVPDAQRHRWQGLSDTAVAACATLGAFLPAPMLAGWGWNGTNVALLPLCIAGALWCGWVLSARRTAGQVTAAS